MTLTESDILRYNQMGLIPGPDESEQEFLLRVDYCLNLREHLFKSLNLPFSHSEGSLQELEEAFPATESLYGIRPIWTPVIYSNRRLAPWHGGCAWIFQERENLPTSAFIQLREVFKQKLTFLGLYSRKELLAHELSHVGRMMFHEKKFEEFFAYRSSSSLFRRWFGPILESAHEAMIFMSFIILSIMADFFVAFSTPIGLFSPLWWLKLIPLGFIAYGVLRLRRKHTLLELARQNISSITSHQEAVLYRLTDREIAAFSKMRGEAIKEYFEEGQSQDLRLAFIYTCYLMKRSDF